LVSQQNIAAVYLMRESVTVLFLTPALFMIATGFGMYSEGAGHDSWQYFLFGWVVDLWGNPLGMHVWRRMGMWVIAILKGRAPRDAWRFGNWRHRL
jgi:Ni,Fe-hydrogenase I cytochrome b subunit